TNSFNCTASSSSNVTVNPLPNGTITASSPVCANSTNTASVPVAGAGASYGWTISGGSIDSGQGTAALTYIAGTGASLTLNVAVTNANGCVTNGTKTVTITALPDATITTAAAVCANSTGNTASVPTTSATYAWTISGGTITSATNSQSITYTAGAGASATLNVTVTKSGCSSSSTATVTINPLPACSISGADVLCASSTNNSYSATAVM